MTDRDTQLMTDSILLKKEITMLSNAFGDLKDEVRVNNTRHNESLNAIRESLDVLVRVEERSVRLQEGFQDMKKEHSNAVQRVHERIDITLKGSIDQQQQFTDLLMTFNDRVSRIEVTQAENKASIESSKTLSKLLLSAFIIAIAASLVSKWLPTGL